MSCLQVGFLLVKLTATVLAIAVAVGLLRDQFDSRGSREALFDLQEPKSEDEEDSHFISSADLQISADHDREKYAKEVRYSRRAYIL